MIAKHDKRRMKMGKKTNLNATQNNHIFSGKGGKMYKRISLMLIVAFAVGLFGTTAPARASSLVPDVVGMHVNDAYSVLESCGFQVGGEGEYSDTVPRDLIISQNPTAGTLVPNWSFVFLRISTGPGPSDLPSPEITSLGGFSVPIELGVPFTIWVNGRYFDPDITASISGPGTSISDVWYYSLGLKVDVVFSYAASNSTQTLTVTNPDGKSDSESFTVGTTMEEPVGWIRVPDVRGMAQADAESAITAAGLAYTISWMYSDTVREGYVFCQGRPGEVVRIGSTVNLTISLGPTPRVEVPDVVGMRWGLEVKPEINSADLDVGMVSFGYSDTVPKWFIISQDPPGGTSVTIGSSVDLTISRGPPGMVDVPDVVGMAWVPAVNTITSASLSVVARTWEQSHTVPYGHVISQDPSGGTSAAEGSDVTLTISSGPSPDGEDVMVFNVVGMWWEWAMELIYLRGLVYAEISWVFSAVKEDRVISQNPAAGTVVAKGSTVWVTVSRGTGPVYVPDVVGMPEPAARQKITSYCLVYAISRVYSDNVVEGYVISQDLAAGTKVLCGSTVPLTISLGPCPPGMVPDVVGMTYADAASAINSAELSVGSIWYFSSDTVPAGCVISQEPAAGTVVDSGTEVDLEISSGPSTDAEDVMVPDVVGMTESDAESAINSAVLSVGSMSGYLYSDTVPAGCVISSYPRAGIVVDAGTEVDLDISMGPEPGDGPPVPVPPDASCPLAHWKLDEIEGAIAYDSSGNGNHGMVYGNPIWQPTGGIIDGTLEFDGDGDYVEVPKIGESVEFTYAMWVAQNQVGSGLVALIDHKDWVYGSVQFELKDGYPKVGINGAITPAGDLDAWDHTLAAGEWHHVALAKSATELLMYVDGEEAARSELIMSDTVILGDGFIGAWVNPTWGQTRYFDGWVDDVRIYDCALDENQIKSLISVTPSPDPLSEALDTSLSFTTGGSAGWFSQTKTSYHNGDAAQSGDISNNQESWMQTTVSGKGTVKFYWKVSSEDDFDCLEFYIDGSLQNQISGLVDDWEQKTYTISTSGSHVLEWRYMKDRATSFGDDCGWLDKVEWITTP